MAKVLYNFGGAIRSSERLVAEISHDFNDLWVRFSQFGVIT